MPHNGNFSKNLYPHNRVLDQPLAPNVPHQRVTSNRTPCMQTGTVLKVNQKKKSLRNPFITKPFFFFTNHHHQQHFVSVCMSLLVSIIGEPLMRTHSLFVTSLLTISAPTNTYYNFSFFFFLLSLQSLFKCKMRIQKFNWSERFFFPHFFPFNFLLLPYF